MTDLTHPPPGIELPKPTERIVYKLWKNANTLKTKLIGELEDHAWWYENSATTTAEAWRIEKKRLDNCLKFWRTSTLTFWMASQKIPREVPQETWKKLQTVVERVGAEAECAARALWWQHTTSTTASVHTPEETLGYLKKWLDEHNPIKACPAVRFYRATFELYEFSVEQGWIKNLDGFGKTLSPSELDQRNRDFETFVNHLMQKREDQMAAGKNSS
ncbi:MAG: hypothetical protein OHK93_007446 [Ramalina farinacea]|uniref:Uncharacterized protein n=1 Tax=Ramalina farinacea TaxID=258253 RepID=A0AA43QKH6_9LECA|nr:hypothetical protein [Ramalina farinacea]